MILVCQCILFTIQLGHRLFITQDRHENRAFRHNGLQIGPLSHSRVFALNFDEVVQLLFFLSLSVSLLLPLLAVLLPDLQLFIAFFPIFNVPLHRLDLVFLLL